MAYTPKTWQCDDTITADELNRMEQGIADASQGGGGVLEPLIIREDHEDESTETTYFDKTWKQVFDALNEGRDVFVVTNDAMQAMRQPVISAVKGMADSPCQVFVVFITGIEALGAESESDYLHTLDK